MRRVSIEQLKLQGSPNLLRAEKREKAEAAGPPTTGDHSELISDLSDLIARTVKACKRGNVRFRKSNPAYAHLALLIRCRAELQAGSAPQKKSAAQVIAEAEKLMGLDKVN